MKLNLGCFNKKLHGFVNVDIREDVNPDVVDDSLKLTKFEDNSVSLIYASHMLEHLSYEETKKCLSRWIQVLKKDGILRIAVPDLESIFAHYFYHKDMGAIIKMIYGSQKHEFDFHKNGWTFESLKADLENAGFTNVKIWNWQTTPPHNYCDDYSQCYYPHYAKKVTMSNGEIVDLGGKLMSLNVEARKC